MQAPAQNAPGPFSKPQVHAGEERALLPAVDVCFCGELHIPAPDLAHETHRRANDSHLAMEERILKAVLDRRPEKPLAVLRVVNNNRPSCLNSPHDDGLFFRRTGFVTQNARGIRCVPKSQADMGGPWGVRDGGRAHEKGENGAKNFAHGLLLFARSCSLYTIAV